MDAAKETLFEVRFVIEVWSVPVVIAVAVIWFCRDPVEVPIVDIPDPRVVVEIAKFEMELPSVVVDVPIPFSFVCKSV